MPEMVQYVCPRTAFDCTPHQNDQDICERTVFIVFSFHVQNLMFIHVPYVVPTIAVVESIQ